MSVRYDAAIIGANADGLAAAAMLAAAGLQTIVIERAADYGGIADAREFHPRFRASRYLDELPAIPAEIFRALDLARLGAIPVPSPSSLAVWPDGTHALNLRSTSSCQATSLLAEADSIGSHALSRAMEDSAVPPRTFAFRRRASLLAPWPDEAWLIRSLGELLERHVRDPREGAHLAAIVLNGRTADPFRGGSALHLLVPRGGGIIAGGRLGDALAGAAQNAGAEIRRGGEPDDALLKKDRIGGIALADGTEIEARAVLSTCDLKRTFLSLFPWNALPKPTLARVNAFRMAGGTARVLMALDRPPANLTADLLRGEIHVAPSLVQMAEAHQAWASGRMADVSPVTLRLVSANDPGLAPAGAAVLTATLAGVPFRLFDGAWTREKRDMLRDRALAAAERVFPGIVERVIAAEVVAPSDMEAVLGATEGDLWGGEIAADQMFGFRPWTDRSGPRTAIDGLYLAGPSAAAGPLGTCASGWIAARALIADFKAGRLK